MIFDDDLINPIISILLFLISKFSKLVLSYIVLLQPVVSPKKYEIGEHVRLTRLMSLITNNFVIIIVTVIIGNINRRQIKE
jgi:hypothetical protein